MRCPECGHKLCGDSNKKSYGVYKSYRCTIRCRGCSFKKSVAEKKLEKYLLDNLEDYLRKDIARVELEQRQPKPKPKTDVTKLKEKRRRLTVAYMAGNVPDDEYLRDDAELKKLIERAEAEAPPKPRDAAPLREVLEMDFKEVYTALTEDERQAFWSRIIKEIEVNPDASIKDVIFF